MLGLLRLLFLGHFLALKVGDMNGGHKAEQDMELCGAPTTGLPGEVRVGQGLLRLYQLGGDLACARLATPKSHSETVSLSRLPWPGGAGDL